MSRHIGLLCIACLLVLTGCEEEAPKATFDRPRLPLRIATVEAIDLPDVYSVPGTVVSDDRIDLSSRVVGFIKRLDVREGQRVAKGDLLVEIDPADTDEAIRQAKAGVTAARTDLEDAEHDVTKYTGLAEKGAASGEVLRKAVVRRDSARSTLARSEAALAAAEAQRAYASIPSPVDGVVVIRHKQQGDLATAGTPLLTIESRQRLLFKVYVAEGQLSRLKLSMPASVRIDALPGQVIEGTIQRIVPSGDPVTRRFEVSVAVPPDPALMPGMFGRAEIVFGSTSGIIIPLQAKVQRGGLDGIYVVGSDNLARFRWLRLGRQRDGFVEVTAGLSQGEAIVVVPTTALREGAVVTAVCDTCRGRTSHD
ncbi:efflux RND transporter periplasmic adaptor subunit [Rhodoplanes roseus]|uniref:Uncharacterized protein n=1 Tax=Rhodoplanes roseus TaxID=29409 RepID=A0A327L201_9BRAD|nr:efflux RND transporter periplasmic adaptor subunit [Rhodoplanes roseus]RAI43863.1 hypothetical protein CH341_12095 [Rhodoplanes roseus]